MLIPTEPTFIQEWLMKSKLDVLRQYTLMFVALLILRQYDITQ